MKLNIDAINDLVATAEYHHFENTTCVVCLLKLKNGCHTVGHASCLEYKNFDIDAGKKVAYEKALAEIWRLEGYKIKASMG